jgi:HTH-type transcriptional repressor of NAD biosynthesis genes
MTNRAFVLMTAMPPTKGHKALIDFALALTSDSINGVTVIVATQPGEPYEFERVEALRQAFFAPFSANRANFVHLRKTLPQEPTPETEAKFWDMWSEFLLQNGIEPGDYIVSSEMYGQKLAEITGTTFIPYDLDRSVIYTKATTVRNYPQTYFRNVLPEFQPYLRKRVTVFGAESTGKTTLSKALAERVDGWWLPEWARPYLEHVGSEITEEAMTNIWKGQRALQRSASKLTDRPFIIQDTDLFSTYGYWEYSEWAALSHTHTPYKLVGDALNNKSDLYIITKSNILFEHDQLRYGGDHREIPDEKWIHLCETFDLDYIILESDDPETRLLEAERACVELFNNTAGLKYQREGKEYQNA